MEQINRMLDAFSDFFANKKKKKTKMIEMS